jgi:hypothetical protein
LIPYFSSAVMLDEIDFGINKYGFDVRKFIEKR